MAKIEVLLRDRAGFERIDSYEIKDQYKDQWTIWEEGNFACDCNRSQFLYKDDETDFDCGDDRIMVVWLKVDGVIVYAETTRFSVPKIAAPNTE